jgi:RNA polymerase sigma-70 factor (ECF subfamily)
MLAGIQHHEDQAWERLFRVWCPVIYDRCRRGGVPAHDAEDVVQNVFLKVAARIDKFERKTFRGWIEAITRTTIADYFRAKQHRPIGFGGSGSYISKIPDSDAAPLPDLDSGSSDDLREPSQADTDSLILQGLLNVVRNDFDERTFEAFWRTAVNGEPTKQVAQDLKMSVEAVRQAKCRVLRRLREEAHGMRASDADN